jgi:hypothetical protein
MHFEAMSENAKRAAAGDGEISCIVCIKRPTYQAGKS